MMWSRRVAVPTSSKLSKSELLKCRLSCLRTVFEILPDILPWFQQHQHGRTVEFERVLWFGVRRIRCPYVRLHRVFWMIWYTLVTGLSIANDSRTAENSSVTPTYLPEAQHHA